MKLGVEPRLMRANKRSVNRRAERGVERRQIALPTDRRQAAAGRRPVHGCAARRPADRADRADRPLSVRAASSRSLGSVADSPLNGWNEASSMNSVCSTTENWNGMPSSETLDTSPQYMKCSLFTTRPLKSVCRAQSRRRSAQTQRPTQSGWSPYLLGNLCHLFLHKERIERQTSRNQCMDRKTL